MRTTHCLARTSYPGSAAGSETSSPDRLQSLASESPLLQPGVRACQHGAAVAQYVSFVKAGKRNSERVLPITLSFLYTSNQSTRSCTREDRNEPAAVGDARHRGAFPAVRQAEE